jgi:hypothetical protein
MDKNRTITMTVDTKKKMDMYSVLILGLVMRGLTFESTIEKEVAVIYLTGGF